MDYEPNDSLWEEQRTYVHHLRQSPSPKYSGVVTYPIPVQNLDSESKSQLKQFLDDFIKLEDLRDNLDSEIKKMLGKQDYSGLFDLYMRYGLSCFAYDLAARHLPEKLDEVLERFSDLEERIIKMTGMRGGDFD